jgi:hypothetical protein
MVNGFTSEVKDLPQAGLPQGSSLTLILFLFFSFRVLYQPSSELRTLQGVYEDCVQGSIAR